MIIQYYKQFNLNTIYHAERIIFNGDNNTTIHTADNMTFVNVVKTENIYRILAKNQYYKQSISNTINESLIVYFEIDGHEEKEIITDGIITTYKNDFYFNDKCLSQGNINAICSVVNK